MLHDIAVVYCLSTSVCHIGFSSDVVDNFVPISTGTSDTSFCSSIIHWDDALTEMLHVTLFSYCSAISLYMFLYILNS